MNPLRVRWLKWLGYPCVAMLAFLVFFYATFPYQKVKQWIESEFSATDGMTVAIGSLGPRLFTGLTARDVVVRFIPQMPPGARRAATLSPDGEEETPEVVAPKVERLIIDRVAVSVAPWRLLVRKGLAVDFVAQTLGGEIAGAWALEEKAGAMIKVKAGQLDLARAPLIASALGLPIAGRLSGSVDLELPRNWLPRAEGRIELSCEGCSLGDGEAKLRIPGNPFLEQGITIPKLRLGEMGGQITVRRGVGRFEKFALQSEDLEAELLGAVNLRLPLGVSALQAFVRFRIGNALKERAKNVPFDLLEGQLGRGKMPDGFFGLSLAGPLSGPRVDLSRNPPRSS